MVQFVAFNVSYQKSLYEICVSTCDDWEDGHDLFPDKQFSMAGDRSVIAVSLMQVVIMKFATVQKS